MLWSSGRGDGSGLDTTLISTSTSCEDISFAFARLSSFTQYIYFSFMACFVRSNSNFHTRLLSITLKSLHSYIECNFRCTKSIDRRNRIHSSSYILTTTVAAAKMSEERDSRIEFSTIDDVKILFLFCFSPTDIGFD